MSKITCFFRWTTSPCVRSKRPRLFRHHAHTCFNMCARGAGTNGDVLNAHMETCWVDTRSFSSVPHHTTTQHNTETDRDRDRERQRKRKRQRKRDKTRQDKTRQDKTRQDKTRQDKTRQDKTRQDKTRQDKTRQDKTRQEKRREEMKKRRSMAVLSWWSESSG